MACYFKTKRCSSFTFDCCLFVIQWHMWYIVLWDTETIVSGPMMAYHRWCLTWRCWPMLRRQASLIMWPKPNTNTGYMRVNRIYKRWKNEEKVIYASITVPCTTIYRLSVGFLVVENSISVSVLPSTRTESPLVCVSLCACSININSTLATHWFFKLDPAGKQCIASPHKPDQDIIKKIVFRFEKVTTTIKNIDFFCDKSNRWQTNIFFCFMSIQSST